MTQTTEELSLDDSLDLPPPSRRRLIPMVLAALVAIVGAHVWLDAREQETLRQEIKAQQKQLDALELRVQSIESITESLDELSQQLVALYDAFNSYQAEAKAVLTKVMSTLNKVGGSQHKEISALKERIETLLQAGRLADSELKEIVRELEGLQIKLSQTQDELRTTKKDTFEVNATRASRLLNTTLWDLPRFQRCARNAVKKSGIQTAMVNINVITDRTVETVLQVQYVGGESVELDLGTPMSKSLNNCVATVFKGQVSDEDLPQDARTYHLVRRIESSRAGVKAGAGNR